MITIDLSKANLRLLEMLAPNSAPISTSLMFQSSTFILVLCSCAYRLKMPESFRLHFLKTYTLWSFGNQWINKKALYRLPAIIGRDASKSNSLETVDNNNITWWIVTVNKIYINSDWFPPRSHFLIWNNLPLCSKFICCTRRKGPDRDAH